MAITWCMSPRGPITSAARNARAGTQQRAAGPSTATVVVGRATVSTQQLVGGTLGYASDTTSVAAARAGVVESVAAAGAHLRGRETLMGS